MPPKNDPHHQAQRRDRKDILQEELVATIERSVSPSIPPAISDERILPILEEALSEGVDVNFRFQGNPLLHTFAINGYLRCFKECAVQGADPAIECYGFPGSDALYCAVNNPINTEKIALRMVNILLNHRKADELNSSFAVCVAVSKGFDEVVKKLLERWSKLAFVVFGYAVVVGNQNLLKLALDRYKVDVNGSIFEGSYIHVAAESGTPEICELLLDKGANIEARNRNEETPFLVAARYGNIDCMKLLIDRGCKVDVENEFGNNAGWIAVNYNRPLVLQLLKKRTELMADLKPYHLAKVICSNYVECFKILLQDQAAPLSLISQLVKMERYEMLSFVLLDHRNIPCLSVEHLEEVMKETTNQDIIELLKVKIELMTTKVEVK